MAKVHSELRPADAYVVQAVPPKTASWEGSQLITFKLQLHFGVFLGAGKTISD